MRALEPGLEALARAEIGQILRIEPLGTAGAAFRVEGEGGRVVYLKAHRKPGKHRQERDAYRSWAPALPAHTAELLAVSDVPAALLLGPIPGQPYESLELDAADRRALHVQAGATARALHGLPVEDPDPMPLSEAVLRRAEAWSDRASRRAPALAARVRERIRAVAPLLQDVLRVPCHRDFEPRNWMVAGEPFGRRLGLLDFEHSRPDLWLADVVRLANVVWPDEPEAEAAFWEGYGLEPSDAQADLLAALVELDAAATYTWGLAQADQTFLRRGAAALERLGLPR